MKIISRFFCIILTFIAILVAVPSFSQVPATKNVLIVYDGPSGDQYSKLGLGYAIMLENLLGHFDSKVTAVRVEDYTAKQIENYDATFYMGSYYGNLEVPLTSGPTGNFLLDVATTTKTVVWFKYNLWALTWNSAYGFPAKFGFNFSGLRGFDATPGPTSPGFFDTVTYKNRPFVKYYAYDSVSNVANADPDIGVVTLAATSSTFTPQNLVTISDSMTKETAPYVVNSGNFWYVADLPFSYIGPRDRYLVLADMLHDMLGVNHAENHQALVRLEDVGALVNVKAMKTLTDYMYVTMKKMPFSIAVIPHYKDPLGKYNSGIAMDIPLSSATNLKQALAYAVPRGGEVVMHGFTHQHGDTAATLDVINPWTGVSGDDFEFWDTKTNSPVAEEIVDKNFAQNRITLGLAELSKNKTPPVAWETPHYQSSAQSSMIFANPANFKTTYQRAVYYTADGVSPPNFTASTNKDFAVGQFFPYLIKKDHYGQRIIPENLGNVEYIVPGDASSQMNYTWDTIVGNADYALTVRDGFGSFFFHPFWLETDPSLPKTAFSDFQKLISGINALKVNGVAAYKWVAPSKVQ